MKPVLLALLLLACAGVARAQPRVTVDDAGPGASGPVLREALRRSHRLVEPDTGRFVVTREVQVRASLIVLGRGARIEGTVDGDVIVVGGDLFVRPGASIAGRAIAIGGGAYPSALAHVGGEILSFRDNTFEIIRTGDGYRLHYRSLAARTPPPLLFPEIYGLRRPQYDRVNGLSLPFGPAFAFWNQRGVANVLLTYRSDLGRIDPALDARLQLSRRARATLEVRRGSLSNDTWIWTNLVNTLSALTLGVDTRNFYRADRAEFVAYRAWEGENTRLEPFLGALTERASTVGPTAGATGGPWSLFGRADAIGMRRPNPAILDGPTHSILTGASLGWESQGVKLDSRNRVEVSVSAPGSRRFQQLTSDVAVGFPTFGEQAYALDVHLVTTVGDTPPAQRFAYLGGPGTLPFLDPLSQGGDELLLIDQRYSIPLLRVTLGAFGSPSLQFRHRIGSAGLGALPRFEQMVGAGISLTVIRGEVQLDPSTGKLRPSAGFTFSR